MATALSSSSGTNYYQNGHGNRTIGVKRKQNPGDEEKGSSALTTPAKKYDFQVVLDLNSGTKIAMQIFLKQYIAQSSTISLIRPEVFKGSIPGLEKASHKSRIYIVANSSPGSDFIENGDGKIKISHSGLADMVAASPQLRKKPGDSQRVKISLVVSHSAERKDSAMSFGEKFSQSLFKKGIEAQVVARKGACSINLDDNRKLMDGVHHKPGSKFSITTNERGTSVKAIN